MIGRAFDYKSLPKRQAEMKRRRKQRKKRAERAAEFQRMLKGNEKALAAK